MVHFAAETHVDPFSLLDANPFLQTNVQGTSALRECRAGSRRAGLLHVSTDEVYGSVDKGKSREDAPLNPTSPYAASKAASDLVVRTQWLTHGYPVLITRCTNNYGPHQHPEKFLPLFLTNAIDGIPLPPCMVGAERSELDPCFGSLRSSRTGSRTGPARRNLQHCRRRRI